MLCFGFTVFSAMNQSLGGPDTRPRLFACLPFSNARPEFLFLLAFKICSSGCYGDNAADQLILATLSRFPDNAAIYCHPQSFSTQ